MHYLFLALIRPITFLPQSFFWILSAEAFLTPSTSLAKTIQGGFYLWIGSLLSWWPSYFLGSCLYQKLTQPWLLTHLPKNLKKAQKNSFSLVLQSRLLFFLHTDIFTLFCGIFGMPTKATFKATLLAETIKVLLFTWLCQWFHPLIALLITFAGGMSLILLWLCLKQLLFLAQGQSYFRKCQNHWHETCCEIQANNISSTIPTFQGAKPPILLLYGFFASRRTLMVMEKLLKHKGYEVFSLNLGGLFDVFFTKSIPSSAQNLNSMIMEVLQRNQLSQITIVAHSKGGLVAAWWLLRLNGHRYCHNLITLGTPFGGTFYTWIALITPSDSSGKISGK